MKISIYISCFLGLSFFSFGQHNYIFNGGISSGFNSNGIEINSYNSIFSGSENDGFDQEDYASKAQNWLGGNNDGFSFGYQILQDVNSIWNGSDNDGMAYMTYAKESNNNLHNGGDGDGFSHAMLEGMGNNLVFAGGEGDGFSASGISKLIWDGDISSDWLMADNWNIPIVPTMNHSACIPSGVPNFPTLSGVLSISWDKEHTYICSELNILPNALVTGLEGTRVVVNGRLIVLGDLLINSTAYPLLEGKDFGHILIGTGGSIELEN